MMNSITDKGEDGNNYYFQIKFINEQRHYNVIFLSDIPVVIYPVEWRCGLLGHKKDAQETALCIYSRCNIK